MQAVDKGLFKRARQGDKEARELLFQANTGLIWACLRKYTGLLEKDDLYQLGAIGLLKALDRFDPSYGVMFSTYAVPLILGEIRRHLRDNTPVKVERRLKEIAYRAGRVIEERRAQTGVEPPAAEVAGELGVSVDTLMEAMEATSPPGYIEDLSHSGDRGLRTGSAGFKEDHLDALELKDALGRLDSETRHIIEGRFFHGKTQAELARELRLSQAHVCRLEKAALRKLRVYLSAQEEILP
ncbi:MAG: sigma-70 family RNA polymerase sigma factor [Bacillota bacterium]